MEPIDSRDYDVTLIGFELIPVYTWVKKLQMTVGEVQLIALLGSLGFVATWFM
jgi:hypothetical protein